MVEFRQLRDFALSSETNNSKLLNICMALTEFDQNISQLCENCLKLAVNH